MEARHSRDLYEIPQRSREVRQLHETRESGVTSFVRDRTWRNFRFWNVDKSIFDQALFQKKKKILSRKMYKNFYLRFLFYTFKIILIIITIE